MTIISSQTEQRIYEILGVKLFRILVFKLEKLIHRKDKGKNTNYHISSYEPLSVDAFTKYLFYNGAIHVRNIIFMLLLFVIRYGVLHRFSVFDVLLWLFFLKDCYCVMLQRYNFLRMQLRTERLQRKHRLLIEKKASKISAADFYSDRKTMESDLLFVRKMLQQIQDGESIIIGEEDTEPIVRLKKLLEVASSQERKEC